MCHWQVAQTVSHVMLDHMSSSGVIHGEEMVKHEDRKRNIATVHVWYCNNHDTYNPMPCLHSLLILLILHFSTPTFFIVILELMLHQFHHGVTSLTLWLLHLLLFRTWQEPKHATAMPHLGMKCIKMIVTKGWRWVRKVMLAWEVMWRRSLMWQIVWKGSPVQHQLQGFSLVEKESIQIKK